MRNILLAHYFAIFFLCFNTAFAEILNDCTPVPFKTEGTDIILLGDPQTKTSQIYFFTNKSDNSVFIDHPLPNPGASAGWSSYLRPGNWAALLLNKKNFAIHCAMIEPGKVVPLHCANTISVCKPKEIITKSKLKGNYWLAEDKNWEGLVKALEKRGVQIK